MLNKNCHYCGNNFIASKRRKYCGRSCSSIGIAIERFGNPQTRTHKKCYICETVLPIGKFSKLKRSPDNHQSRCKECEREAQLKIKNWTSDLKQNLFRSQDGQCAICKEILPSWSNAHADHNHSTNQPRGLLCGKCNRLVGVIENNLYLLGAVNNYLTQYTKQKIC